MDKPDKRATNRDVAALAGVSVATVSYVINGREDMRIPEATKKKVLQAVNFLNYSPNPFAVQLKTNPSRTIALRTGIAHGLFQDYETMLFLRDFNATVRQNKYTLSYLPDKTPEKLSCEACICFDMNNEEFHALGQENFIPLVAVDCLIDDPIFYQIIPDYQKIKAASETFFDAPYDYVCIRPANAGLSELILTMFPDVVFVSNLDDIRDLKLKHNNLLLTHQSLFIVLNNSGRNIFNYDSHLKARPRVIFDAIKKAVSRTAVEDPAHFIKV